MTFSDLQNALERLSSDPRVHPSTRVEIAYSYDLGSGIYNNDGEHPGETIYESEPLLGITLSSGYITLCATREEAAVAR